MFGISFTEILLIASVALVVVGPQKLPRMLGTLGDWIGRLRRLSTEMRRQAGIDEILRQEGLEGGIQELRSIMRGDLGNAGPRRRRADADPYDDLVQFDRSREYPVEGPDSYDAIPDDLVDEGVNAHLPAEAAHATPSSDAGSAAPPADENTPDVSHSPKATA